MPSWPTCADTTRAMGRVTPPSSAGTPVRSWATGLTDAEVIAEDGAPVGNDSSLVNGERRLIRLATATPAAGSFVGTNLTARQVNSPLRERPVSSITSLPALLLLPVRSDHRPRRPDSPTGLHGAGH